MASQTDICNVALGHLGVTVRISSINPPDGSVEADRCKMFYPLARRALIEATTPKWAAKRGALALLATNPSNVWSYAYALPENCIKPLKILPSASSAAAIARAGQWEEYSDPISAIDSLSNEEGSALFASEGETIFTHEPEAVLVYLQDRDAPTAVTPLWEIAHGYMLASMLAGGTLKGRPGATTAKAFFDIAVEWGAKAAASDGNAGSSQHQVVAPWLRARR